GVDDEAHARPVAVGEQLPHTVELVVEAAGGVEDLVAGHGQRRQPAENRAHDLGHPALHREDALHVPGQNVGKGENANRLGRRRLAHASLPGEQQDARPRRFRAQMDSTRRLSSRRAVPMILASARRLTKPGMGIRSSTSKWYVTRVPPSLASNVYEPSRTRMM